MTARQARREVSPGDGGAVVAPGRGGRGRRWTRRAGLTLVGIAGLAAVAGLGGGLWLRQRMLDDLPRLDGRLPAVGLTAPVRIERDALGVPAIRGASRRDVAFATGFVHAQDRLFQMDILRRRSAGRLAELLGSWGVEADTEVRRYLLEERAKEAFAIMSPESRQILEAYAQGVNAGRASLAASPFEYLLLRSEPEPWRPEDSLLVLLTMYLQQSGPDGTFEKTLDVMRDRLPAPLFAFLAPLGTEWDSPLAGGVGPPPPLPGPEAFDLRRRPAAAAARLSPGGEAGEPGAAHRAASNAWAVDGRHAEGGGALLANDLHLDISVPNLWYRLSLTWPDLAGGDRRVAGVTLPGAPAVVVGSNGHVAWGVANSGVDTADFVVLDVDPAHPDTYRAPGGPRRFAIRREVIRLHGGGEKAVDVKWTEWGPVVGPDHNGRLRAVRWAALEEGAVDFGILGLEEVRTVEEAFAVAHRSGVPPLSFVAADAAGSIGWTILGRLPRRVGFDGRLSAAWSDGARRWEGLLAPDDVPQVLNPGLGRIWAGNQRMVDGEMLARLGDGGYRLGARARQARDALLARDRLSAEDLRRLQLDDRALFLDRWHDLLLSVLTPEAVARDPRRREMRALVERWGGHAAVGSAGYRMVRTFRTYLAKDVFDPLTAPCKKADPSFDYTLDFDQWEGPLWALVTQRPANLLDPRYATWDARMLATVDEVLDYFSAQGPLAERTWGERNTADMRHRLSPLLPGAGRWLDMPAQQLPGDDHMPRVQDPGYGATLRMVVSPGREDEGFFSMPGGQSGNPLSPHYRDSHPIWAAGRATPFLPGPPVHRLELLPAR